MKTKFIFIIIITIVIIIMYLISGIRFLTVTGSSMNPSITQDDIVIIMPEDFKYLKVGDVITYRRYIKGNIFMFSHRIIDIEGKIIKTKGDNMPKPDEYNVIPDDIVGKVIGKIPYIGYLIRFVHSTIGYLIFIFIPTLIIIIREVKDIIKGWKV